MQDLADYEVLCDLGRDRGSEWFRARRTGRGSPYRTGTAEIILRRFFPADRTRLIGELDLSTRLSHPNLWGPKRFLDSNLCEVDRLYGWNLRELVDTAGPLPLPAAVTVARDVCAALAYLRQALTHEGHVPMPHAMVLAEHIVVSTTGHACLEEPFGARRRRHVDDIDWVSTADPHVDVMQLGVLLRVLIGGAVSPLAPLEVDVPSVLEQVMYRAIDRSMSARPPSPRELDWNLELVELAADWTHGRMALVGHAERGPVMARLGPFAPEWSSARWSTQTA